MNETKQQETTKAPLCIPKWIAIAGVVVLWAAIYLPSIGAPDFSRNECRRVLPAMTMINSGDWKTPMLSGKPYYRKPPLINWMIAASLETIPAPRTVAARIPTPLAILATALLLLFVPRGLLSPESRLLSALLLITTVGLAVQGRQADIDPNYVCCSVMAAALWLDAWSDDSPPWRLWLLPAIPLAAGMLLKGPLILLVYYVLVAAVLAKSGKTKKLLSLEHAAGIALTLLPFILWALSSKHQTAPAAETAQSGNMAATWFHEMAYRFRFGEIAFGKWAGRIAGGVAQFLPWLLPLPLLWFAKNAWTQNATEKEKAFAGGAKIAIVVVFVMINALPATKARYSLPLLPAVTLSATLILARLQLQEKWLEIAGKTILWLMGALLALELIASAALLLAWTGTAPLDKLPAETAAAVSSLPWRNAVIPPILAALTLALFGKNKKLFHSSTGAAIALATAVALGLNATFSYIIPLDFQRDARNTAAIVDEFNVDNARIVGVGFFGEEPFAAHLSSKSIAVDKLEDLADIPKILVIGEEKSLELEKYKKTTGTREIRGKRINYKSHRYIILELEGKNARKTER